MNIISIGGGPAGLYFALLMKKNNSDHNITVIEQNKPYDTFGWGVVFSDATMKNLEKADKASADEILANFHHWTDIDIFFKGEKRTSGGHGFVGIGRKKLLNILQERCEKIGVNLVFEEHVEDDDAYIEKYDADLVIAADGINSFVRTKYQDTYKPDIDVRKCQFVWLGTKKIFNAFTFLFEETKFGWFQVHAYQFDDKTSTFIVETTDENWQKAGIKDMKKEEAVAFCENIFAKYLDGEKLISNANHLRGSAIWMRFPRTICENWVYYKKVKDKEIPIVLMGDAVHTAHYSIGSGTKLALEDAILLANILNENVGSEFKKILPQYEIERKVEVEKLKNAARNSTQWFEQVNLHSSLDPNQFSYSCLTRSQRISHENLKLRDSQFIENFQKQLTGDKDIEPSFMKYQKQGLSLKNRFVEKIDLFQSSTQINKNTSLILSETIAINATARSDKKSLTVNDLSSSNLNGFKKQGLKVALQIGHAGRKSQLSNLLAPSAIGYSDFELPRTINSEEIKRITEEFVVAAQKAQDLGADVIVIDASNGGLLSTFLSPLSNSRNDNYGGSIENRSAFIAQVAQAVKAETKLPLWFNLSITDWHPKGNFKEDTQKTCEILKSVGVDLIIISTGGVVVDEKPVLGRMYRAPYSDFIRNIVQIDTLVYGNIKTIDDANGIIGAGRSDLCIVC